MTKIIKSFSNVCVCACSHGCAGLTSLQTSLRINLIEFKEKFHIIRNSAAVENGSYIMIIIFPPAMWNRTSLGPDGTGQFDSV